MKEVSIKRIQFLNVSGFLVYNDSHVILVDTGHSHTSEKLLNSLASIRKEVTDIGLIILTHTHFDHAGGARMIREWSGGKLAVHKKEASNLARGFTPFPPGTRWKGKIISNFGSIVARKMARYPSVNPDIIIEDEFSLQDYGIPGMVYHTPGHTQGSLSVVLENGSALVGDNVMGIAGKTHFPPFATDKDAVLKTWQRYIDWELLYLFPAHGRKVKLEALARELPLAKRKYASF